MSGHDQRRAPRPLLAEVVAHVCGRDRIESSRWLVAEDPVGIVQRRPDEGHLLRHSARVRREHSVGSIGQLETLEQRRDTLPPRLLRNSVEVAEAVQVFERCVASIQPGLVRHDAEPGTNLVELGRQAQPIKLDQPGIRPENAAEAAQCRGLARTVLSKQDEDLAALDVQVDAVDSAHVAEALA